MKQKLLHTMFFLAVMAFTGSAMASTAVDPTPRQPSTPQRPTTPEPGPTPPHPIPTPVPPIHPTP
jgi:hypothetical protein